MNIPDTPVERKCGSMFGDLGLPDADAYVVKAELMTRIYAVIRHRCVTQAKAARPLGLSQPCVSQLLKGDFREPSLDRLLRLLTTLGRDICIVIHRRRSPAAAGALRVAATESDRHSFADHRFPCPLHRTPDRTRTCRFPFWFQLGRDRPRAGPALFRPRPGAAMVRPAPARGFGADGISLARTGASINRN